ncbi:MAG TPA: glucosaminidase domain-containing protein [Candidatus Sulfotelmatobacter sp.]|nr:glucosaminidase domain-containing protein [Candidatus Sulfotelmatobacter sp.]
MDPRAFAQLYQPHADVVSRGTGIDPGVLLAQWANETAWGSVVVANNLGNIRCSPTTFCKYATLEDFSLACIATWQNGYYAAVLAAVGVEAQLAAVCASPWSGGHYGGNLHPFYDPLEVYIVANLDPNDPIVAELRNRIDTIFEGAPSAKWQAFLDAKFAALPAAPPDPTLGAKIDALTAAVNALTAKLSNLTLKAA